MDAGGNAANKAGEGDASGGAGAGAAMLFPELQAESFRLFRFRCPPRGGDGVVATRQERRAVENRTPTPRG